jgi:uncharacterized RDD family membrane protein YckC
MYPSLLRRVLATLIDVIVVLSMVYLVTQILFVETATWFRVLAGAATATLYGPLFTLFACTLGQAVMRIRVLQVECMQRSSVRSTYLRFLTKYIGGVLAGAVNEPDAELRAYHDHIAGTVVVTADTATEAAVTRSR